MRIAGLLAISLPCMVAFAASARPTLIPEQEFSYRQVQGRNNVHAFRPLVLASEKRLVIAVTFAVFQKSA